MPKNQFERYYVADLMSKIEKNVIFFFLILEKKLNLQLLCPDQKGYQFIKNGTD